MTNQNKHYFNNLDTIRTLACLFVLVSHIIYEFLYKYFEKSTLLANPVIKFFIANGGFGVQIFFSLSGFLITYLLLTEYKNKKKINLKHFYIRRILRIWPVYFIVVIFVFLIYAGIKSLLNIESPIHESLIKSVFFLSNYDLINILSNEYQYANGMLALTWSVSVEEQFYLIWPLIIIIVGVKYTNKAIITLLFIALLFIYSQGNNTILIYHHTISNIVFLGSGALLAYFKVTESSVLTNYLKISSKLIYLILVLILLVLVLCKSFLLSIVIGIPIYVFMTALFLFILLTTQIVKKNGIIELNHFSKLANLAKYTYGLYMYHRIAGFISSTIFEKVLDIAPTLLIDLIIIIIQIVLTFVMAFLSYQYIEKPLLKLKVKFT